ncbi:hypothetical protein [Natronocalculus amylovorans]|uniref:DUF8081 domain-containing protein n=1 Tax=Natronocalculus amylovorans TaxID=2917812 RepID=A0AAE3K6S9_9EURY|nr:hypothetical protein [Natronocalculus amylovorans]MCL9815532.1 hypothetical protein [Natronocalculus amylovorans]
MFVVEIKPSARKRNPNVGRLVNKSGTTHTFESRSVAERWAAALISSARTRVWIQSAHPADRSDVDAYLLSRNTRGKLEAAYDKRRRRLRGGDTSAQKGLPID